MKPLKLIQKFGKLCAATAVIGSSLTISNCGGGISGGNNESTVRPKSLSGLEITLDNNAATIQFVRSAISESAIKNGEFEEGAVRFDNNKQKVTRQMLSSTTFDVYYPVTTERITYKYTALNNSSGLLQIICTNADFNKPINPDPTLQRISYYSETDTISTTNYFLTFASDGNTLTGTQVRVAPNTLFGNDYDAEAWQGPNPGLWIPFPVGSMEDVTYLIDAVMKIAGTNSPVPVNYDVVPDTTGNLDSTIAVNTLDQKTIFFIPDNPAFDEFSGIHTKGTVVNDPTLTEEGDVLVFLDIENNVQIGGGNYSYDKIPGTDDAELIYYGNTGHDNTYRLNFRSLESAPGSTLTQRASGFYEIQGGLQDGQTGFFYIRDDINIGGVNN